MHILSPLFGETAAKDLMLEFLGIDVEYDDLKPKIICENCHKSLLAWMELKKKAAESEIVINYIASKKTVKLFSNASNEAKISQLHG
ncbi:hypothetical protein ACI65C_004259 [Semiaphis heraclei]